MRPRKLKPEHVREIRNWKRQPTITDLARKFGVTARSVRKILNWESYKDITA